MMTKVVIVGGGPAGSAAAFTLLKQGFEVVLIDKSDFPRNKLCGGLLTQRSRRVYSEVFETDFERSYECEATGAGVFQKATLANELHHATQWYLTRREHFDHHLLELAKAKGLRTVLNDRVVKVHSERNEVQLANGTVVAYDFLIGADGVNSVVAKHLFGRSFDKDRIGFALEVELPKGGNFYHQVSIHFDVVNWGYGWIFPKTHSDTFGIVGRHALNPQMKAQFLAFHKDVYGTDYEGEIKGHYIPFGQFLKVPGAGNILLSGDAAGLVDPVTGEGIAFALESGAMAGEAVARSIADGRPALSHYQKRYNKLAGELRIAARLAKFLYPERFHQLFLHVLPKSKQLLDLHLKLMEERLTYAQFERTLWRLVLQKGWKLLWK